MPLTLVIIFGLLVMAFRSVSESILILLSVPFAMVGGVFLQWVLGYPMTTAVIIGYISLFAVAVQTGIIMVIFIREALDHRKPGQSLHRRGHRRIGDAAAAEADDRGHHRAVAAARDVLERRGHGDHEADRRAEHRRHGHLQPSRAVHDAVSVCHR